MSSDDNPPTITNTNTSHGHNIIGVRCPRNCTTLKRCYSSLTAYDRVDLLALSRMADSTLSVQHVMELLTILTSTTLILAQRISNSGVAASLEKASHIILALLVLCKDELDIFT